MDTAAQPFWKRFFQWKSLGIVVLVLAAFGLTAIVGASYLALQIVKLNAQHNTLQLVLLPTLQTIEWIRMKQLIYGKDHGQYAASLQELDSSRSFNAPDYYVYETSRTSKGYSITASPGPKLTSQMNDLKSWGGNFIAPVLYTDESGKVTSTTATVTSQTGSK